ncbi:MAG: DUF362 domain-containing protein [Phormidesmis sp. RL_2_1]|nr:DUF362 domain-containing protein [Phormidesmis sp. RL_2_1]
METVIPSVSLIRAQRYDIEVLQAQLVALLAPLGGMTNFVKPGDRVLLKPNLLTSSRPTKGCTTRPEVVYCVAKMVQAAGGKPFLGDSPAFGSAHGVAKANGLLTWAEKANIPIVELHGKRYPVAGPEFDNFLLSKEAMEADVVINLPKVKSHVQLTMSLGVKNLFGCVPGKMKAWWHMEAGKDSQRFGTMLVETARAISPQLTIIDGIVGQEGSGPINGEPRDLGVLGASNNVFALDRAMVEILNVDPAIVPTLAQSQRLGLCPELAEIAFPLMQPAELKLDDWKLPETMVPIDFGAPRVLKSTFKHLYIRFIQEPMAAYATSR